jgi:hypothetical protein
MDQGDGQPVEDSMTARTITYDDRKFSELLLHVAEESLTDPNFGKTKLNKILYFSDFLAFGIFGTPITGATYQRRPYGPVPKQITRARQSLIDSGDARIVTAERFGRPQSRLVANRPPNLSLFTNEEKTLIDDVIADLWNRNGSEVSELSHRALGWKIACDLEEIPYETVFLSSTGLTAQNIARGQEIYKVLQSEAA